MRRSPRRPLILKRRKLPFQQNEPPAAVPHRQDSAPGFKEAAKPASSQCLPTGVRIMDHPSMSDTQVVVIPKTANIQTVIGALNAKGKECGTHGPNKFILLSGNGSWEGEAFCPPAAEGVSTRTTGEESMKTESRHGSPDAKPLTGIKPLNKDGPLDDSLTNIQWLGRMSTCALEPVSDKHLSNKENQDLTSQNIQVLDTHNEDGSVQHLTAERPPYSYMAMIQFAINSRKSRRMTLKEIYTWIEEHFPYYREVAKPGWKNSVRHNLSLHDMFVRETSPDDKISLWTIRPEANRCLTLDQVYKPGCDPMTAPVPAPMVLFPNQQSRMLPDARRTPTGSGRRMKPLLPRTDSYLVPIQLPVVSSIYLPPSSAQFPPACSQQRRNTSSRGVKRVRIAPKVTQSAAISPHKDIKVQVKEEPICVPIKCETPKAPPSRQARSSRRKQRLVHSVHEEPVLLCLENTFFDSGVASDVSTFQHTRDTELEEYVQDSPDREFSFKTPIKSSSQLTSSTPSKPPSNAMPEPWKVTPVGKGSQNFLDFSPIRTPGGPTVTPRHDYTTFSLSTPFKDWPLFNSPREPINTAPSRGATPTESPSEGVQGSCSRELLQACAATPANRSITEGLVLDTMNDSLSKILVDISFSCLDDEDVGMANISWSEFLPQLK
ncbi:forkhead box protein M1 [Parambassis ranga]|uniref:Forkhead box protein M1 n=1 Tax=Parambassis ranga TaxID=210632 RepID=A0A6P7HWH2_9TELE|nr:forkhead box protein M1 [Parambassis ranga]